MPAKWLKGIIICQLTIKFIVLRFHRFHFENINLIVITWVLFWFLHLTNLKTNCMRLEKVTSYQM